MKDREYSFVIRIFENKTSSSNYKPSELMVNNTAKNIIKNVENKTLKQNNKHKTLFYNK